MSELLSLLFWPALLNSPKSISFAAAVIVYVAAFAIPVAGVLVSIAVLRKRPSGVRANITYVLLALSAVLGVVSFILASGGLLALNQPLLVGTYLPLGPALIVAGLVASYRNGSFALRRRSGLITIVGVVLTYLLTAPWAIALGNL